MKTVVLNVLLIASLFVVGCSKGESYVRVGYDFSKLNKVAVVEVAGVVEGDVAKNQIADFLGMELLKKGYAVVERAQVQALLDEQNFQASDLTLSDDAAKAGRILNIPVVLVANIPQYDENVSMTAKMIDVQDASILWMGSGFGSTGKTMGTILGAAVGATVGAVVAGGDSDDKVVGGIIGGILGGVAGQALTPEQAENLQELIKDICEDLPSRFGPYPSTTKQK
ncbi:MAG: glycine zipper 2TM domain-containing protein [Phycisphaerae bacterium]|nr:glycine zipper 2TM domain-containing protein [Phycisphaerae bacterium]NIW68542.1 glycine zipper 2TM domain-containing protein [candidate division KSB1 bacterium]NIS53821.1 glycine zipper 2TM domain-containing protein [Phycisphaerae bacterium]NIU11411.1 glycine zipper 2TM domain-containing protein [Phycisphaerae bacterium]NIU58091.1 glycine zipper 2TM domain-containing protein [Phycisphaerae bacterium]